MSRVALVTGSARGIGRAIVLALARQGFDVAVHYHTSALEAEQTRQEALRHGVRAIRVQADVTRVKEAQGLIEEVAGQLGGLQVLVNNVGNYLKKPIEATTPEEWHAMLDSNLNAPFYLTQAALPYLGQTGYGRVVNIGFAGAQNLLARPEITPYVIAKTGLILYSKALAQRLAPRGITVNVVAPGVAENSVSKPLKEIPMGRLAHLEELARAVLFFVDEQNGYITGQVMEVSGGWNL
ncbi:bifunctional dihydropteridine reductase/dihydrofolate reductase TmpR [Meiothermus ruber]|jgi:NAD(P)-dependent dehydrogenase (short-subunit alcohol dehydrogenase family)|uniref:Short-chain dehydrogenase/reductase SDR n=1 Tax=Meiothermus ruber (strain ATCC 35948 / DSM 1279 / VKM B-1258 / 21) TaxID=504728 RepID=D3PLH1_MEIRD|nr:bifunctional dihydropteridine reductase/dihydrofolate reductase TmpR [Meiothermus ruber]ADD29062.1 short-chain dehydrogenase/reductase SDR [Meiothermus ruber DSM 1279]AGK05487.1 short-chain dehydrogenase/reductase SDR [Meiothermus ruber DSM 1279]MCL6528605.1 bifunctional dihydropteridine reductase/dihydrofolate reductase TmpR [Meiothermus ruber]GAO75983.1 short-chain dehydrogenase/reductase SDR [Meiothermus ruber H328]